jgi:GIY-YIG catalytic domain
MKEARAIQPSEIAKQVEQSCKALLEAPRSALKDIPRAQGAYVIYNSGDEIIYVGKAQLLKRRICDDHCGGDEKMSTSTFRRSASRSYGVFPGSAVKRWVRENCSFVFLEIPDSDLLAAVEAFTVLVLRREGCKLLNA